MAGLVPQDGADAESVALGLVGAFRSGLPADQVDEIERAVSWLSRDPDARLRMTVARRTGRPFSEVSRDWTHEDLIAELAWDSILSADRFRRCPQCGVGADEVLDPDTGVPLDDGLWKLYLDTCYVCGEMERADRQLRDATVAPGTRWKLVPRAPGEPFRDDGGVLADE